MLPRLFKPVARQLQKTSMREFKNVASNVVTAVFTSKNDVAFRGVDKYSDTGMSSTTGCIHPFKKNGETERKINYGDVVMHTGGGTQLGVPVTTDPGVAARFGKYLITVDLSQCGTTIDVDATTAKNTKPIDANDKEQQKLNKFLDNVLREHEHIVDGLPKSAILKIELVADVEAKAVAEIERISQAHKSNTALSEIITDLLDQYPKDVVSPITALKLVKDAVKEFEAETQPTYTRKP